MRQPLQIVHADYHSNGRGKRKPKYRHQDYRTPWEKLTSLPGWPGYLKDGITEAMLTRQARHRGGKEDAKSQAGDADPVPEITDRQNTGQVNVKVPERCGNDGQPAPATAIPSSPSPFA